ncbi:MAG: DNA-protecting protein DprA [Candidatus Doudnabacteria bacterium]|nr:DNA-protecting protein DprA [Candidatus Doudnabacteria bacterium]
MADINKLYLHAFNTLPQFGPARLFRLANYFNHDFKKAFHAPKTELLQAGLESEIAEIFLNAQPNINLKVEQSILEKSGISILTYKDLNYPKLLLEIPKFPPLLYFRGVMENPDELDMAVVGTRKITAYGRSVLPDLIAPLVEAGVIIVSGMAFGVDSEVHKQALIKHKRTIAVLGGGLDDQSLYPKHHQLLAQEILDSGGALLSEYPPGTPNFKQHFVARNRIISGLSIGTLVIECDLESGSLITARHALEQNRQVYAVPGPIYAEESRGPNNLIKMGAKAVTEANDILEDLNLKNLTKEINAQEILGDNPVETKLLAVINKEPVAVNEIIKISGLDASEVTSALTFLEMKGKVRNLGGQQYVRSR